jgi:steroid 5-alpha reductase family enzyme
MPEEKERAVRAALAWGKNMSRHLVKALLHGAAAAIIGAFAIAMSASAQSDPLPSWNDTAPKSAIVSFVEKVSKQGSPDFVPEPERIAVFDNDGTLWTEQPNYFQGMFAVDRVKAMAPEHPEWKDKEPFASLLKGDMAAVAASGEKASSNS